MKGGAAVAHDKYDGFVANPAIANPNVDHASETRWGATVGVGGEFAFNPSWSVRVKYNHVFFGDRDITFTSTTAPFAVTRTDRIS